MKKRLRILYTQWPTGGGSTRSLYELLRGLDRDRYEPIVLFLSGTDYQNDFDTLGIETISLTEKLGRYSVYGMSRTIANNKVNGTYALRTNLKYLMLVDIPVAWAVARIIRKYGVDLVHQNLALNRGVTIGARLTRVPQVHHFRLFGKYPISARVLMSNDQRLVFISRSVYAHYLSRGIPEKQSTIIYNPFDVTRIVNQGDIQAIRNEFNVSDNDRLIINVGRITPWKGQIYFLDAMVRVANRHPNIKILVIGSPNTDKDSEYMAKLRDFVAGTSIEDKVTFTGLRSDVLQIMAASDVVVHSASEPEPFGRVIVEAMLAGTPVVATDAGGVPEIIKDRETGMLVPVKNAHAMEIAIEEILVDKGSSRLIAEAAKKYVAEQFSVRRHVEQMQTIYDELCSSR